MYKLYTTLLITLIAGFSLHAQDEFYNDGASVTVEDNAEVYVDGNVKNDNATITNNGLIELSGDYHRKNGATYNWGNSGQKRLIRFKNTTTQSVYGSPSFYKVKVNNPRTVVAGNWIGGLELQSDLTVAREIDLSGNTNSKIATNSNKLIFEGSSAGFANIDTSNGRYIQLTGNNNAGEGLEWKINSTGDYRFPIGTENERYTGFTLSFSSVPSNESITAKFVEKSDIGTFGPTKGFSNNPWFSHIVQCSGDDQWVELDRMIADYGVWDISPSGSNGSWNYDITIEANATAQSSQSDFRGDFQETGSYSTFKLLKTDEQTSNLDDHDTWNGNNYSSYVWNDDVWNSGDMCEFMTVAQGQTIGGNPSIQGLKAENLSSFSRFAPAGFQNGSGLPVELINLEAHGVDNEYIRVNWATATEVNNDGFEVHRRQKGTDFKKIGWVEGNGTTQEKQTYNFDDYNVEHNTVYYYRLKQIDFNGKFEKTQVVTAMIEDGNVFTISDFIPNPSTEDSKLMVNSSEKKDMKIKLYNTLGQVVSDKEVTIESGSTTIDFSLDNVADGTYHAVISVDNEVFNRKLVITKD
ncbi:MAG: hypothetical protein BRD50_02140 [Bacteroidetes bacterium SW_11_45_7]|nr:MAG: hypothetical protein BRD50_02140 [Bacteroidetes bacterium SW_11_45_7]